MERRAGSEGNLGVIQLVTQIEISSTDLPGLYQTADRASIDAQNEYFGGLCWYLFLLTCAALVSFASPGSICGAIISAVLFLITLGILILLRVKRPDGIWYNGRAVAESVKTRSWRWMMRADPYQDRERPEIVSGNFINDLKAILDQNRGLSHSLQSGSALSDPISLKMKAIRGLSTEERLKVYVEQRITQQANWYWHKAGFNKRRAQQLFWTSVFLHSLAILLLMFRINDPSLSLPIEVIATAAGAVLTWLQAKKHNELNFAYTLAAHEIVHLKGETDSAKTEDQLSDYVVNSEAAFSREHTQWAARKGD